MSSILRNVSAGVAAFVAGVAISAGIAMAQQPQPIIIDAETNAPIQITGLSDGAMTTLRDGGSVTANTPTGQVVLRGEIYRPGIWTDPDGCQHWVMDDGAEGYMAPILTRQGKPICNGGPAGRTEQFVIRKYDVPYSAKYGHK